jgi:hypothetical protein
VTILAVLIGYALCAGPFERAVMHDSSYLRLRPVFCPVNWIGEQPGMGDLHDRYLVMWTGESLRELRLRRILESTDFRPIPATPTVTLGYPTPEKWADLTRQSTQ